MESTVTKSNNRLSSRQATILSTLNPIQRSIFNYLYVYGHTRRDILLAHLQKTFTIDDRAMRAEKEDAVRKNCPIGWDGTGYFVAWDLFDGDVTIRTYRKRAKTEAVNANILLNAICAFNDITKPFKNSKTDAGQLSLFDGLEGGA